MKSIVILGSGITALGVLREAHRLGLDCTVFDTRRGAAMASRLGVPLLVGQSGEQMTLARLAGAGSANTALIATEDRWLRFIAAHRFTIEHAFGAVLAPSNDALDICLDKGRFARWCAAQALPTPRSWSGREVASVRLPALVRPASTLHERCDIALPKAVFVQSSAELSEWTARFQGAGVEVLISESLLPHRVSQYSVPFSRTEGMTTSFVARKVRPPASWARTGTYVERCTNPEVEQLARDAVERLDVCGIGEVEILQSEEDGCCYLVEVNARPWLQYSLAAACGYDLLGMLLRPVAVRAASKGQGRAACWLNFSADFYVCFARSEGLVLHGELTMGQYLRSLWKANAFAYFNVLDPWPAVRNFGALARDGVRAVLRRAARTEPMLQKGA